jgi:hexokinase
MKNQFDLNDAQLADIARNLSGKIVTGLRNDGTEIKCLPTYIHPKKDGIRGKATVFDLGGTNFRIAAISVAEKSSISSMAEKDITEMKKKGFTREDLFRSQSSVLNQLEVPESSPIGYCFSYPAKSLTDGDAELIKWTKGVSIPQMEGQPIGKPLLNYMNKNSKHHFTAIRVVNDTITSLFAGLLNPGYDAYIGIIVGTGTNMATFFPSEYIPKIRDMKGWSGETPVNLESGNFYPPHLTAIDDEVDAKSENKGGQRFEKAVSGMYLGRVFKAAFPGEKFDDNLSAVDLTRIINNPSGSRADHVEVAFQIYERSAKLIAASIGGLVNNLHAASPAVKSVQVLAEGSLFWSRINSGRPSYSDMVNEHLTRVLDHLGLPGIKVTISKMENANLIGAAMAVLS